MPLPNAEYATDLYPNQISRERDVLRKLILALSLLWIWGFSTENTKSADVIIKNGTVLTMNAEREIIEAGVVVIRGNKIVAVGSNDLAAAYSAADYRCEGRYYHARHDPTYTPMLL